MIGNIVIGIDPDVDKSGVAVFVNNCKTPYLYNLRFFDLFEFLRDNKRNIEIVYIEAGWLISHNWHKVRSSSQKGDSINASIGNRTGANHETGRKICEMCEYLGIEYKKVIPKGSKISSLYFNKITNYDKRSNQEQRDAAMVVIRSTKLK